MNDITIERGTIDSKDDENVYAKMLKRYANRALVDITNSPEFTHVDKNFLNNRIVVRQSAIKEKKLVRSFEIAEPTSFSHREKSK